MTSIRDQQDGQPPEAGTDTGLALWVVLARAFAAVARRAADDIASHGLTTGEFGVLEALYHRGPLVQGELQRKVLVSSGGMTYLVDRLVEKGLVVRRPCARDRRVRVATLSADGRALIARIFPGHARSVAAATSGLSRKEQVEARRLLRKLGRHAAGDPHEAPAERQDPSG